MLRDHFKLIFIVLITSSVLSQEQEQKYLFVGHAYGAPDQKDKKIDPYLCIVRYPQGYRLTVHYCRNWIEIYI